MQTIFIRLDANKKVGLGHLFRSISIANEIRKQNNNVHFLISDDEIAKYEITKSGFKFLLKEIKQTEETFLTETVKKNKADLIFIDKIYPFSPKFILELKKHIKVALFHNLCEGAYFSDIFILPSAHTDNNIVNSEKWKSNSLRYYSGAKYIVLNKNTLELKKKRDNINIKKNKVVIITGGSDSGGVLLKILPWINSSDLDNIEFVALKGVVYKNNEELNRLSKNFKSLLKIKDYNLNDIAEAEIVIATFGVSIYELFYAGIPVLSIGHAPANANGSKNIEHRYNALIDFGYVNDLEKNTFVTKLKNIIADKKALNIIAKNGEKLIDNKGVERVANILLNYNENNTNK